MTSALHFTVSPKYVNVRVSVLASISILIMTLTACGGCADIGITSSAMTGGLQEPQQNPGKEQGTLLDIESSKALAIAVPKKPFSCAKNALTCVEVASTATKPQTTVPFTFGLPLKAGAWNHQVAALYATDDLGKSIVVQADDISSHRDGSARFAVISAMVKDLQAGERRVISLFAGGTREAAQELPASPDWNLEVVATIYSPQTVRIKFGNRSRQTAGTPFYEGETIGLTLTGEGVKEHYSLTVNSAQAGGGYITLQAIAEAFKRSINEKSKAFIAEKPLKSYENFFIYTKEPSKGSFDVTFEYTGSALITATTVQSFSPPQKWAYRPQNDLIETIKSFETSKAGKEVIRFKGPVASEFHLAAPLVNEATGAAHPFLTARLDARFYEQGKRSRTDVILENNWTFKQNPRNIRYDLTIKLKGKTLFYQPVFEHFHHARWRTPVWDKEPRYVLRHHIQDFFDSKAVHNYDLSLLITESTLNAEQASLKAIQRSQSALGPMGNVFLRPDFLSTGGRPENGPLPKWTVMYLLTQDQRAFVSMMANADATAGVPIHYRDEYTDLPFNPLEHSSYSTHINSQRKPPLSQDPTIWSPDQAHQASYSYVPYLLTGDRFFLDELMFWASWNVLNQTVANRQGELALLSKDQVRAQAWSMRSFGEVVRALPDRHPMKNVYSKILQNNLDRLSEIYITKKLASPLGAITHLSSNSTSPWQMDYFMTTMSLLAQNHDPYAQDILNWWGKFAVGRFLSDDVGFCATRAPGGYWPISRPDGSYLTSMKEIFELAYPNDVGKDCSELKIIEGYPESHTGYVAYARGALAAAQNASVPGAGEAYRKWKSMNPLLDTAFASNPSWAIVPRD